MMKAVCVHKVSTELADHQQGRFAKVESRYDLTLGKAYLVLGMGVWETVLQVLVRDDFGTPCFCPAALFEIEEQPFPSDWHFALEDGIRLSGVAAWTHWIAVWGYKELVVNRSHGSDLGERNPEALAVFEAEYLKAGGEPDRPEGYEGPWPGWPAS